MEDLRHDDSQRYRVGNIETEILFWFVNDAEPCLINELQPLFPGKRAFEIDEHSLHRLKNYCKALFVRALKIFHRRESFYASISFEESSAFFEALPFLILVDAFAARSSRRERLSSTRFTSANTVLETLVMTFFVFLEGSWICNVKRA